MLTCTHWRLACSVQHFFAWHIVSPAVILAKHRSKLRAAVPGTKTCISCHHCTRLTTSASTNPSCLQETINQFVWSPLTPHPVSPDGINTTPPYQIHSRPISSPNHTLGRQCAYYLAHTHILSSYCSLVQPKIVQPYNNQSDLLLHGMTLCSIIMPSDCSLTLLLLPPPPVLARARDSDTVLLLHAIATVWWPTHSCHVPPLCQHIYLLFEAHFALSLYNS